MPDKYWQATDSSAEGGGKTFIEYLDSPQSQETPGCAVSACLPQIFF